MCMARISWPNKGLQGDLSHKVIGAFILRWNDKDVRVVQRYVKSPMLIEGRKTDLRLYALVRTNPLRIYLVP